MTYDVFISYAAEDGETANLVLDGLESSGLSCWIAPRNVLSGIPFPEQIVTAIKKSRLMLVVFSASSNRSGHVRNELNIAVEADLGILPMWIDDFEVSKSMKYYVGTAHWFDAREGGVKEHLPVLIDSVKAVLSSKAPKGDLAATSDRLVAVVPSNGSPRRWGTANPKVWLGVVSLCAGIALVALFFWGPWQVEQRGLVVEESPGGGAAVVGEAVADVVTLVHSETTDRSGVPPGLDDVDGRAQDATLLDSGTVEAVAEVTAELPDLEAWRREVSASETDSGDGLVELLRSDATEGLDTLDIRVGDGPSSLPDPIGDPPDAGDAVPDAVEEESAAKKGGSSRSGKAHRKKKEKSKRGKSEKVKAPVLPVIRFRDLPSGDSGTTAPN